MLLPTGFIYHALETGGKLCFQTCPGGLDCTWDPQREGKTTRGCVVGTNLSRANDTGGTHNRRAVPFHSRVGKVSDDLDRARPDGGPARRHPH